MKRKGFTLIELIVVIAIIGILAAILVPAMLGYVARSKITTANSAAKEIYNSMNQAMIEMSAIDLPPKKLADKHTTTGEYIYSKYDLDTVSILAQGYRNISEDEMFDLFYNKIAHYFADVEKISDITFLLKEEGCEGVGIMRGRYPGTYPIAISVDDFNNYTSEWDSDKALNFALNNDADVEVEVDEEQVDG